jgi:aminopeptidase N
LGWQPKANETYFDKLLRPTIISLACYAESSEVTEHAKTLFVAAKKPEDIPADIRTSVLIVAGHSNDHVAFEQLITWYMHTTSADMRRHLAAGLTAVREPKLVEQLLIMLTREVKLQDIFYWFAYLMQNPTARQATWQWVHGNWSWIEHNFAMDLHFNAFARYSAEVFSTREELEQYKRFFEPLQHNRALGRDITKGIEVVESRVLWRERDLETIAAYLRSLS